MPIAGKKGYRPIEQVIIIRLCYLLHHARIGSGMTLLNQVIFHTPTLSVLPVCRQSPALMIQVSLTK